jgi:multiple sugar transport system substrate-binding protein
VGKIRIIAGLLVLFILTALFSGCDSLKGKKTSADETAKLNLTFYYSRDGSQVVKKLVLDYNKEHDDVVVNAVEVPGIRTEFTEKLKTLLDAGEAFPDILLIHDTWLAQLAQAQYIRPLDGGLSNEKKGEFFPGMMDAMAWEGKIYGLPFWQDTPVLYYRSDLVQSPPANWEQLEQTAENTAAANEIPNGFLFPGKTQESAADFLAGLWSAYHAYPDFRQAEVTFDEAAMPAAWNRLNRMVVNGVIPPDVLNMNPEDCRASFEKGNAVFMWNWSYAARLFQDEKSPLFGKVGIAPIPGPGDGTGSTGILSGYALVMSKKTTSIPEVWSFMQYMTGEESQSEVAKSGLLPARASLYGNAEWQNQAALPSWFRDILASGRALKLGSNADSQLNMMAQSAALAIGQRKDASELMLYLKEGVVAQEPVDGQSEEQADGAGGNPDEQSEVPIE